MTPSKRLAVALKLFAKIDAELDYRDRILESNPLVGNKWAIASIIEKDVETKLLQVKLLVIL